MENEHLKSSHFQNFARLIHAGCGVSKLASHDNGFILGAWRVCLDHAANSARRASEDLPGNAVQPCHIDDAWKHDDVLYADILRSVAAGQSGHHHLWKSD